LCRKRGRARRDGKWWANMSLKAFTCKIHEIKYISKSEIREEIDREPVDLSTDQISKLEDLLILEF
jgi:hypothetical protein